MKPRHAATGRYLMLLGAGCLVIVVLTHVCEAFHLFPVMGWGLKDSRGHYLDLSAAILGLVSLPTGYFLAVATEAPRLMVAIWLIIIAALAIFFGLHS